MSITKAMNALFTPIGLKTRSFALDYQDANGIDYNKVICKPCGQTATHSDKAVIAAIKEDLAKDGYRLNAVHEMLDGYDYDELEKMLEKEPLEAVKHIKRLY